MSTDYGQSYTDKKTQSTMMRFLKKSNQFTGSSRVGASKPKTQLNKDSKPKNDFFDNPRLKVNSKGRAKGSNADERLNESPVKLNKRNETQKNDWKPRGKKATGRPTNTSKISRRWK
jgi:hypothetical protein